MNHWLGHRAGVNVVTKGSTNNDSYYVGEL